MMTSKEIGEVRKWVNKKRKSYAYGSHTMKRIELRGVTSNEIRGALFHGDIVEVHFKNNFPRVLIRGRGANKQGEVTCVVFDLSTGAVITSYKNQKDDNHATLDTSAYSKDLDVIASLKATLTHT